VSDYSLGVDIGGTFTDLVWVDDATGAVRVAKLLTTPKDPSQAVEQGVVSVLHDAGSPAADVRGVQQAAWRIGKPAFHETQPNTAVRNIGNRDDQIAVRCKAPSQLLKDRPRILQMFQHVSTEDYVEVVRDFLVQVQLLANWARIPYLYRCRNQRSVVLLRSHHIGLCARNVGAIGNCCRDEWQFRLRRLVSGNGCARHFRFPRVIFLGNHAIANI